MDLIDRTKLPLKVGDKVTWWNDNKTHTIVGYYFSNGFNNYNSIYGYVIDNISKQGHKAFCYGYDKEGNHLKLNNFTNIYVSMYNVKLINTENMKEFTKNDLKAGMIVELNNGNRYLLVNDTLIGTEGYMILSKYNDDLIHKKYEYSINKVYLKEDYCWGLGFNENLRTLRNTTLLWERPKVIEMSVEEIAEKLGIPANQLRIKK